jgi:broad specificity phosphatase PhoE
LLVTHQVVILVMRYLLEHLTEQQVLAIDRAAEVANCAVTRYDFDASLGPFGGMRLHTYNEVAPLVDAGEPITREPDARVAPR